MAQWQTVTRDGARKAKAAGLQVRTTAAGFQVWVTDEALAQMEQGSPASAEGSAEGAAELHGTVAPTATAQTAEHPLTPRQLVAMSLPELEKALGRFGDEQRDVVVKAAARDQRSGARPLYRAWLGDGES